MKGTLPGPDLPMTLGLHAMVAINSTCSMVIAGYSSEGSSALTFYYHHIEEKWITGPSLMQKRYYLSAGIVTDEVTNEHSVAVTGGYFDDSTEILQDGIWVQGKISVTI